MDLKNVEAFQIDWIDPDALRGDAARTRTDAQARAAEIGSAGSITETN